MESENRRGKKLKLEDKFGEEQDVQKPNLKEEIEANNNDSESRLLSLTKMEDTHKNEDGDATMETASTDMTGHSNSGKNSVRNKKKIIYIVNNHIPCNARFYFNRSFCL